MGGSSKTTVGHKYYMGMHMIICHGPVDEVQKIIVGEREAWAGSVTESETIQINKPELFGGIDKEGGIQGPVDIMMGEADQPKNLYLMSQIGSMIPAFRGVVSAVLNKVYLCAMSQYPKPWAFKVKRIPARDWYPATAEINGSANFAHIIYETLTNKEWGMGYPVSVIDDTAFREAALKLYNEELGGSVLLMQQDTIESFIYQMVGHCNGMLYTRPDNGKFVLKLLREDYDIGLLPMFDENNVLKLQSFERPQYAEMVNEVVVTYHPQGSLKDDSVTVHNLASIQAQQGTVSQSTSYPGIDTAANAAKLAMRDLRQKSTPLCRLRMSVNRKAWNTTIGGVFKFSWAEHEVSNMVFRVFGINYGTLDAGEIVIDAVEDIFGFPETTYIGNQPPLWVDPIQPPASLANTRLENSTYFQLANNLTDTQFAELDSASAYATGYGVEPAQYLQNVELWSYNGSAYEYSTTNELTASAITFAELDPLDTTISLASATSRAAFTVPGSYAYLNNEIIRVDTFDQLTMTITVGRGCLDTVPTTHSAGSRIWFAEDGELRDPVLRAPGPTVTYKFLPRTGQSLLPLASTTGSNLTLVARHWKPYPPGKFKINANDYPPTVSGYDPLVVTGAHRDRTQQTVRPIIDHTAGNIGPEPGTTYNVEFVNTTTSSVIKTVSGLATPTYTLNLDEMGDVQSIRVDLWSVRASVASWQKNSHTVVRVDDEGNPITPGTLGEGTVENYTFIGGDFICGSITTQAGDNVNRFYSSTDGITFSYCGTSKGANLFSRYVAGLAQSSSMILSFPKSYAMGSTILAAPWYFTKETTFKKTYPPAPELNEQPFSGKPLVVGWDAANSRFFTLTSDKTLQTTTDGASWTYRGMLTLPSFTPSWDWFAGMYLEVFKEGSYWYCLHSLKGSQYQANSLCLMQSTNLLTWSICPGTDFSGVGGVTWNFFRLAGIARRGTTMVITGYARRDTGGAVMKEIVLHSTDGYNFSLVYEEVLIGSGDTNDFPEVAAFGATGFVATGPGGLLVSNDNGATWARTAMTTYPTNIRSNGSTVIGSRRLKLLGGGAYTNEPWYTTNGTTWTKCTVNEFSAVGTMQHWRVRTLKSLHASAGVTYAELKLFDGATLHTGYTKSQGAGTGLTNVDDADAATYWSATQANIDAGTAWVAYDLGSAKAVTAFELTAPTGDGTKMPSTIEVECSSDGTNWSPVWYEKGLTWTGGEMKRLERV